MTESQLHEDLAVRVRELMREKGLKLSAVAAALSRKFGVSTQSTYSYISSIRHENVALHQELSKMRVAVLLDYLGVPAKDEMRVRIKQYNPFASQDRSGGSRTCMF